MVIPEHVFGSYGSTISEYLPLSADVAARAINFLVSVFGVTFILVLFGELLPKIYANVHHLNLSRRMARPMELLTTLFAPLSAVMIKWSDSLESRINKSAGTIDSNKKDELEQAIEFSVDKDIYKTDEADLLKGIINFGEVSVKQIMKSRMDVVAIDMEMNYQELLEIVRSTLEDIMEEIIGEIKDEFDDDLGVDFTKIDDYTYIFEGKVLLNDACRVLGIDLDEFDKVKGGSDSLAGLMLEIAGSIPKKNQIIEFERYTFHTIDVSKKRIESVKVVMDPIKEQNEI